MSHVSLNFEDDVTGEIAFRAQFTGGCNPQSPAHTLAVQVTKWLDEQAVRKTEETPDDAA